MTITRANQHSTTGGFTLLEMITVLAIVLALIGLAIPGYSVWRERRMASAINQVSAMLQRAHIEARTRRQAVGLFFYVDPGSSAQHILALSPALDAAAPTATAQRWRLSDAEAMRLPRPYRVVPTALLDPGGWSEPQIADDDLRGLHGRSAPSPPYDGTAGTGCQFHRNFFVVIFGADGQLQAQRQVLVWDPDPAGGAGTPDPAGPHAGLRCRLTVSGSEHADLQNVLVADGPTNAELPLALAGATGLLLYDDDALRVQAAGSLRRFLGEHGEPLFIHRLSGRVIRGQRPLHPE